MKKEVKLVLLVSLLIISFCVFLYFLIKPYNYEKNYTINNFKIKEIYNKDDKLYNFYITYSNITYPFIIDAKYSRKREIVESVKKLEVDNEICILPISKKIAFYPLCSNNNELYTYNLSTKDSNFYKYEKIKETKSNYNNITINSYNNLNYLLYNYKGFYLLNNAENKNIKLFEKDVYNINLIYEYNDYLIVPDYNSEYYFNKLFIINAKSGKVKEMDLKYDISFDSVFLGDYKNKIYLLDKKEQQEYSININKNKIEMVDFQIVEDNKLVNTTYLKIINNNLNFLKNDNKYYQVIDEKLFMVIDDTKIRVSNNKISKIVKQIDDTIYFLSEGNLYMYNNINGEFLLLSNFEWNFNTYNMVYIIK